MNQIRASSEELTLVRTLWMAQAAGQPCGLERCQPRRYLAEVSARGSARTAYAMAATEIHALAGISTQRTEAAISVPLAAIHNNG